jgi:hypothetical protein
MDSIYCKLDLTSLPVQIEMLEQVGIQYFIVDLEPYRELEALDTFASKIINKMS